MATKKSNAKANIKNNEPIVEAEVTTTKKVKAKTSKKESKPKADKKKTKSTKTKGKKSSEKEIKAKKSKVEKNAEVVKTPKQGSLAEMIINAANEKYPYRTDKGIVVFDAHKRKKMSKEEFEELTKHRTICQELVRLSKQSNNFPFSALVYFAVGTDAHRPIAFNKGYKSINIQKAETILRWLKWFADYNKNPRFFACDKIVHAFTKLYNNYSKKDKDFKTLMKKWSKMPYADGFKTTQFKNMQQFYELLTKPLIAMVEVCEDEDENIISLAPNPIAEVVESLTAETEVTTPVCNDLVLRSYYELDD